MFTKDQAEAFRTSYDAEVKVLSRQSKAGLIQLEAGYMKEKGMSRLFGQLSKDELISSILDLLGLTNERLNESIHVLYHGEMVNDICPFCSMTPPF